MCSSEKTKENILNGTHLQAHSQNVQWMACIFCKRKWEKTSLEFELCPDCFRELKYSSENYEKVRISMLLKYGQFEDENLTEIIRYLWNEIKEIKRRI